MCMCEVCVVCVWVGVWYVCMCEVCVVCVWVCGMCVCSVCAGFCRQYIYDIHCLVGN